MTQIIHSYIKLIISCKEDFTDAFGPGTASLLRGVQEGKSLNQATKNMGMSYSKAWKSIRATEKALGITLLIRNGVKGSSLTVEAKEILTLFDNAQEAAKKAAEEVLAGGKKDI